MFETLHFDFGKWLAEVKELNMVWKIVIDNVIGRYVTVTGWPILQCE